MTIIAENSGLGGAVARLLAEAAARPEEITLEMISEATGIAAYHVAAGGTPEEAGELAEASILENMAERLGAMAAAAKLAADKAREKGGKLAADAAGRARAAGDAAADAARKAKSRGSKHLADAREGYLLHMIKAREAEAAKRHPAHAG